MVKRETFDPERGWVPHGQIVKELEDKAKTEGLTDEEIKRLEELKFGKDFEKKDKTNTKFTPIVR